MYCIHFVFFIKMIAEKSKKKYSFHLYNFFVTHFVIYFSILDITCNMRYSKGQDAHMHYSGILNSCSWGAGCSLIAKNRLSQKGDVKQRIEKWDNAVEKLTFLDCHAHYFKQHSYCTQSYNKLVNNYIKTKWNCDWHRVCDGRMVALKRNNVYICVNHAYLSRASEEVTCGKILLFKKIWMKK